MNDIEDLLRELLDRHGSGEALDREFRQMLDEDNALNDEYRAWCRERSLRPRNGYREFVLQLLEQREDVWNDYTEFDS